MLSNGKELQFCRKCRSETSDPNSVMLLNVWKGGAPAKEAPPFSWLVPSRSPVPTALVSRAQLLVSRAGSDGRCNAHPVI